MNITAPEHIIYADFGNTNTKILMPDGNLFRFNNQSSEFSIFLQELNKNNCLLVYSSVNKTALFNLKQYKNIELIDVRPLLDNLSIIDYSEIDGVGSDRLFGLAGALSLSSAPLISIDSGTAITINVLDENNKMLGGTIMPGIRLHEQILKGKTKGLKNINVTPPTELLGTNTNKAVSSGIFFGVAEALNGLLKKINNEYFKNKNCNIFLTGGDSLLILPYLQKSFNIIHDELLVIKGIKSIYEIWSTEKN